jgi:hypothetical protein
MEACHGRNLGARCAGMRDRRRTVVRPPSSHDALPGNGGAMKSHHVSRHRLPPAAAPEHPSYCPSCLALVDTGAPVCPVCGNDLTHLSQRKYRDKLLAALNHPLADVRLRAIIALGWRGEGEAALALAQCALHHPVDIIEGLQVVESLHDIRDKDARRAALRMLAERHPARAVRWRAAELITDDSRGATP